MKKILLIGAVICSTYSISPAKEISKLAKGPKQSTTGCYPVSICGSSSVICGSGDQLQAQMDLLIKQACGV